MRHLAPTVLLALLTCHVPALGQVRDGQPIVFKADNVREEGDLVIATGNVEFSQGERTLFADAVTYDRRAATVTASGNVVLAEASGDALFADRLEFSDDLRDGIVENLRVRLANDSRIAAAGGRLAGEVADYRKAVYSPCKPCKDNSETPPIWQLKAFDVTHDQAADDIVYRDAFLEFAGIPVLYTPYFSHPDPTVDRRTGFLTPSYGSDDDLGAIVRIPYYIDIAPDMDATLTPTLTTKGGSGAALHFRHLLGQGEYDLKGSAIYEDEYAPDVKEGFRGHVRARFRYEFDEAWRGGGDAFLANHDTYLRRYGFGSENTLENRAFLERFAGRSYAAANAYYFQGLREEDEAEEIPVALPVLDYSFVGQPEPNGEQWRIDANLLALTRVSGRDTRRASARALWQLPRTTRDGHLLRLFGSLQTDLYWTNDLNWTKDRARMEEPGATEFEGRFFPQIGADWSLPLVRASDSFAFDLEPTAALILAPDAPDARDIPNEDSLSSELDDTNVFSANRFTGIDRVEGSPRVSYGIRGGLHGSGRRLGSFLVGQSYRLSADADFRPGSGLESELSDIVGRIGFSPLSWVDAAYRFRLDRDSGAAERGELRLSGGVPLLRVNANYLSIKKQTGRGAPETFDEREELIAGVSSKFARHWQLGVRSHRDLAGRGRSLQHGVFLVYEDDCFRTRLDFSRKFTLDRDIRPRDTIFLQVEFKTLGAVSLFGGGQGALGENR